MHCPVKVCLCRIVYANLRNKFYVIQEEENVQEMFRNFYIISLVIDFKFN